jgi:hypothetical protein
LNYEYDVDDDDDDDDDQDEDEDDDDDDDDDGSDHSYHPHLRQQRLRNHFCEALLQRKPGQVASDSYVQSLAERSFWFPWLVSFT